ncbi:serine/threonine protein kinase [Mycobacterium sp. M1]|uniref:non-specific serine/threonine protein kinase n=1 Tax=Mycolicibacter acidiphilus TaxID=2835306 RepID=A0ABS5RMH8_9MYCO|nr:serine/threonine-protein kinase [Mycolicibacter acidiphilus]MBS9535517.1 serine/threonine protein kinase [Mycolicibacter acidiphilus]
MGAAGGEFGGYLIDHEVGRGGHAVVYRAQHGADGRPVALKVLDERHRTPVEQARLDREFEFAREVDHPNVVTMYDRGEYWLAMQYVDGGKSTRLRSLDDQLTVLAQIADALDCTHHRGIVHCDVKPANILVPADFPTTGAVLVDFGVAHAVVEDVGRHQQDPQVSLPYAAPEVLLGRAPSAASDEYALACTAVELFTGTTPFTEANAAEMVDAQLHRAPPALSREFDWLPKAFDVVLGRAIAKIPEVRYRSCTELVENLRRVLG